MKKILWVSPYAPYDNVAHAGGKTENFYIKGIHKINKMDLYIISCYDYNEREKIKLDIEKYKISNSFIEFDSDVIKKMQRIILNFESKMNPFNKYACKLQNYHKYCLTKQLKHFKKNQMQPDIIILEWTEVILMSDCIKKIFPNSKIVAIEEDVSFLGYERNYEYASNVISKFFWKIKLQKLKKIELNALKLANIIWGTNQKDALLLKNNGVEERKIKVLCPYYDDFQDVVYSQKTKDILFYGAMSRKENYLAAMWFIENVLKHISDKECRFVIIGANPPTQLVNYDSDRIKVLGFVDDVSKYFKQSMCMVAPLQLGAGIKIKVLEALSAGIPVLTNEIGIEGISAKDKIDYLHCETVEDYVNSINWLLNDTKNGKKLSINSKEFMKQNFNKQESLLGFLKEIELL